MPGTPARVLASAVTWSASADVRSSAPPGHRPGSMRHDGTPVAAPSPIPAGSSTACFVAHGQIRPHPCARALSGHLRNGIPHRKAADGEKSVKRPVHFNGHVKTRGQSGGTDHETGHDSRVAGRADAKTGVAGGASGHGRGDNGHTPAGPCVAAAPSEPQQPLKPARAGPIANGTRLTGDSNPSLPAAIDVLGTGSVAADQSCPYSFSALFRKKSRFFCSLIGIGSTWVGSS